MFQQSLWINSSLWDELWWSVMRVWNRFDWIKRETFIHDGGEWRWKELQVGIIECVLSNDHSIGYSNWIAADCWVTLIATLALQVRQAMASGENLN